MNTFFLCKVTLRCGTAKLKHIIDVLIDQINIYVYVCVTNKHYHLTSFFFNKTHLSAFGAFIYNR